MNIQLFKKTLPMAVLILFLTALALSACQPQAAATEPTDGEHEADHEHADGEDQHDRVPNNGAAVHIVSPADGASFKAGEDIAIEIEVENFDLSAEGNHWHLYVDGSTIAQMTNVTKEAIHDLEPGEHTIEVYLGLPTHEELEDGASITITVTE